MTPVQLKGRASPRCARQQVRSRPRRFDANAARQLIHEEGFSWYEQAWPTAHSSDLRAHSPDDSPRAVSVLETHFYDVSRSKTSNRGMLRPALFGARRGPSCERTLRATKVCSASAYEQRLQTRFGMRSVLAPIGPGSDADH